MALTIWAVSHSSLYFLTPFVLWVGSSGLSVTGAYSLWVGAYALSLEDGGDWFGSGHVEFERFILHLEFERFIPHLNGDVE